MYLTLSLILAAVSTCNAQFQPSGIPFKNPVTIAPGFTASVLFSNLTTPRGITFDSVSNLLVVERGLAVTAFTAVAGGVERTVVISNPSFTQGIQVDGSSLYVSTAGQMLLYEYDAATKSVASQVGTVVVEGIPPDGDLTTHTLQLTAGSHLGPGILISTGPQQNIDPTARDPASLRSQIRFFAFPLSPTSPVQYSAGELIAFGIRNPAGIAFAPLSASTLYAVENGASIDNVTGLTAQFVNDNPADELEKIALSPKSALGQFYGFPDCTTLWNPDADPVGDPQYTKLKKGAQISLLLESDRDNKWCMKRKNNLPPSLSFQAHSVPLDLKFYTDLVRNPGSFPSSFKNDGFVSFHGSFNRVPPTGYGVVHVPFTGNDPTSKFGYSFLIQATNLTACPGACIRPVGLAFGKDGKLYVSSDASGELFVLEKS